MVTASLGPTFLKKISLQHNIKCFKVYPTENDKNQTETIAETKKNPRIINLVTTRNLLPLLFMNSVNKKDVVVTYMYPQKADPNLLFLSQMINF